MSKTTTERFRILLVEDNDDHAELIARCLYDESERLELKRLGDGEEAIAWLHAQEPPGLILLDLRLPKVDGIEVLRHIKGDEGLRNIPVVILTTSDAESDVQKAYGNFANSYVVKPLDFSRLRAIVQTLGVYWLDVNRQPLTT